MDPKMPVRMLPDEACNSVDGEGVEAVVDVTEEFDLGAVVS